MSLEFLFASGIGVLAAGGFWLILRARTFDVILGLTLLSYAVNLFIFAMGRLSVDKPPITPSLPIDPTQFADPLPQGLVLTAIVIGFATTALFLVMMIGARGLSGSDHVDGEEPRP